MPLGTNTYGSRALQEGGGVVHAPCEGRRRREPCEAARSGRYSLHKACTAREPQSFVAQLFANMPKLTCSIFCTHTRHNTNKQMRPVPRSLMLMAEQAF